MPPAPPVEFDPAGGGVGIPVRKDATAGEGVRKEATAGGGESIEES